MKGREPSRGQGLSDVRVVLVRPCQYTILTSMFFFFKGTKLSTLERAASFAVIIKIDRRLYSKPGIGFTWQPLNVDFTQQD